jgi:hypothetical protein
MLAFTGSKKIEVGAVDDEYVLGAGHGRSVTEFTALPADSGSPGSMADNDREFAENQRNCL